MRTLPASLLFVAVCLAVTAPARAAQPVGPGPSPLEGVYLQSRVPGLVSNVFALERTDDLKVLFPKLDPKWLVHTTQTVTKGYFLASAWGNRFELDPTVKENLLGASDLRQPDWFELPKLGWAMGWRSTNDDEGAQLQYAARTPRFRSLAKDTPGFVLGCVGDCSEPSKVRVTLLALDGSMYDVPASALTLGAGPVSAWPKEVQHTLYVDSDPTFLQADKHPENRPWEPPPQPLVDKLHTTRTALNTCNVRAWSKSGPLFEAIDVADIRESARESRREVLVNRFAAAAYTTCRGAFVNHARSILAVNEDRRKNRGVLYEANKARFGK